MTNLNVISQVTLSSCEEECSKNAKCVGYTYITSSSQCDLKDESGIAGGMAQVDGLIAGLRHKPLEGSYSSLGIVNGLFNGILRTTP